MTTFDELKMEQLRKLGYKLEEFVDHEVRGSSIKDLQTAIIDSMAELSREDLELLDLALKSELNIDLGISAESEVSTLQEETLDPIDSGPIPPVIGSVPPVAVPPVVEDDVEDIYVQVRDVPPEEGLYNNDLLKNPTQKVLESRVLAQMSEEQFVDLKAAGYRHNCDTRYCRATKVEEQN